MVLLAATAVLPVALFAVLAAPVIETFFGARYAASIDPARLLVFAQAVNLVTGLAFVILVAAGRRMIYLWAAAAGTVCNIGLNLLLIGPFGVAGTAWATVVTEFVVLAVLGREFLALPIRPLPWRAFTVTAGAGVVAAAIALAGRNAVPWPVLALVATAVYLGLLHLLRVERPRGLVTLLEHSVFEARQTG
jgi:O-antigen/teichoic acid export membrane protein